MIRFFLVIGFLSLTRTSREVNPGNCENTFLENLEGVINTSSSDLTKEVLTTFLIRVNGESRFNATKERKCKNHSQTYQQFLDKTSLHLSRHTVCGNSYFKISVATLMTFLHLDKYVCSDYSAPYQAYVEQINRITILQMVSRHIHHDRNGTIALGRQCLNENKLQKMVDIIHSNQQHFQHQHSKRNLRRIPRTQLNFSFENSSTQTHSPESIRLSTSLTTPTFTTSSTQTHSPENKRLNTSLTTPTFTTSSTISSELNITKDPSTFTLMKSNYKGEETHCFVGVNTGHPVCISLNSTFQFTSFYCMKRHESGVFKCAKYRQSTLNKQTKNDTFTLVLMSSFSNETVQGLYRFAEQIDFVPPFERLSWTIKYISFKPLKVNLDRPSPHFDEQDLVELNSSSQTPTLTPFHMTTTKKPNHITAEIEIGTSRTHGSARKYQHNVHHHVTEQEARAALIVYAVIKEYLLQPRDLPCPKDILQSLFSYWGSPNSQYLSIQDIQKKFQIRLRNKNSPISHETHAHKKRSSAVEPRVLPLRYYSSNENPFSHPSEDVKQLSKKYENGHSHEHSSDHSHGHFSNSEHNYEHHNEQQSSQNYSVSHGKYHQMLHENLIIKPHLTPPEQNKHQSSGVHTSDHGHSQQVHGHPSPCSHLLSPVLNEHREHYGEDITKNKWV